MDGEPKSLQEALTLIAELKVKVAKGHTKKWVEECPQLIAFVKKTFPTPKYSAKDQRNIIGQSYARFEQKETSLK